MRPIDTNEIEREIERAEQRKRDLDEEIERLERLEDEIPSLTSQRTAIENELEETREELAEVEAQLEDVDADPAESKDRKKSSRPSSLNFEKPDRTSTTSNSIWRPNAQRLRNSRPNARPCGDARSSRRRAGDGRTRRQTHRASNPQALARRDDQRPAECHQFQ